MSPSMTALNNANSKRSGQRSSAGVSEMIRQHGCPVIAAATSFVVGIGVSASAQKC